MARTAVCWPRAAAPRSCWAGATARAWTPCRRSCSRSAARTPSSQESCSMHTEPQSILVVIPALNEVHAIESVVDALAQDWPAGCSVRMVVADGGSTDGTVPCVRRLVASRPWLSLLPNPQRIQSAAVNLAARVAGQDADVLVRCDAHADYPPGYVRQLVETLTRTGADAVVVPMDSGGSNCVQRAVAWVSDTPLGSGGSAHRGGRRSGVIHHGHHPPFPPPHF